MQKQQIKEFDNTIYSYLSKSNKNIPKEKEKEKQKLNFNISKNEITENKYIEIFFKKMREFNDWKMS